MFFLSGYAAYWFMIICQWQGKKDIILKYLKLLAVLIARIFQVQCIYEKQNVSAYLNTTHNNFNLIYIEEGTRSSNESSIPLLAQIGIVNCTQSSVYRYWLITRGNKDF